MAYFYSFLFVFFLSFHLLINETFLWDDGFWKGKDVHILWNKKKLKVQEIYILVLTSNSSDIENWLLKSILRIWSSSVKKNPNCTTLLAAMVILSIFDHLVNQGFYNIDRTVSPTICRHRRYRRQLNLIETSIRL